MSQANGDRVFVKYYTNLKDGNYHHYACTIENNSLFKVYLDGKKILEYTRSIGSDSIFAIYIQANWNGTVPSVCILNYRVSKGLRWTKDFEGQTPMDDIRWTIKENNDNMYGVKKG